MSFDIVRTTRTLPGKAAAVRARLDVDTGGQAVAQAEAGLGKELFILGTDLYAKQGKAQSDDAEMNARLSMVQLVQDIRKEDDVSKWEALYKKHESKVLALTPKHRGGAARYRATIKKLTPVWEGMFVAERERKLEDNMLAASFVKEDGLQRSATIGNMAEVIKKIRAELILRDKLSYSISRSDTEILLADVGRDVQTSAAENLALNKPEELLARIKGNKIEGFNEITEATEVVRLGNMARGTINRVLASLKDTRDAAINAEQGRLMQLVRAGKLTDVDIRNSQLAEFGVGSKDTFYKMIDAQAKAILEEKETPYTKSDPVVEARILEQIRDPSFKITEKDITELVGNGLSIDDASRMIGMLDVFKGFWFKRGDLYLKQNLGWSDAYVKFVHPEGALAYSLAMDELFDAIETEKLKDKDIYDRAREIAIPHLIDYWENALVFEEEKLERLKKLLISERTPKIEPTKKTKLETLAEELEISLNLSPEKALEVARKRLEYEPTKTEPKAKPKKKPTKAKTRMDILDPLGIWK